MRITEVKNLSYQLVQGNEETEYTELINDTRNVCEGCLFVCVKGANFDPHEKLAELTEKGAKGFIIEHDCDIPEGVNVYKVDNSRTALALASAAFFGYPIEKMVSVAITGTKGKTTTANMIRQILVKAGHKCGVIGTLGIDINGEIIPTMNTTPESYDIQKAAKRMVEEGCEYFVMEASSQAILMHRIEGIEYDYGIFTNIENDHIGPGEHKDFDEYLMCKTKIFDQVKHSFINADNEHSQFVIDNCTCKDIKTFGTTDAADYKYDNIRYVSDNTFIGLEFDAHFGDEKLECEVAIPGRFNAPNAMGALCVCRACGIEKRILETALKDIFVNGRMELVYGNEDFKVIVDFAHNEVSTVALLETLRNYNPKRLVVVFGCGGNRSPERRYGMGRVCGEKADFSIITEDNNRLEKIEDIMKDIHKTFDQTGGKSIDIPLRPDAVLYAIEHHEPGDIIAIIGKGHEDYIDKEGKRTHYTDQEAVLAAIDVCKKKGIL